MYHPQPWELNRGETYHRLVNTTPKPNATKNRSGELVLLLLLLAALVGDGLWLGEDMVKPL